MTEKEDFRPAMNWLHTWAGVTLGALLLTIWWTGTLSIFVKEIDRWMQPETRLMWTGETMDADAVIAKVQAARPGEDITEMLIQLPRERRPYFEVYAGFEDAPSFNERLHPITGESLGESLSRAGSGFFYIMHYRLLIPGGLGYFVVAFATFFMMILIVTGVVIHRKIFADFFTFRPDKKIRRSSLDVHNLTGVVFLPFHFLICLSGFAIFAGFYISLPFTLSDAFFPDDRGVELFYAADDYAYYQRPPADEAADMTAIAPLVARAEALWTQRYDQPAKADRIDLKHVGDKNAYVEVRRYFPSRRSEAHRDSVNFDGVTGEVLMDYQASPIRQVRTWLEGFHQIQFDHWALRWLYFVAGLAGCVLIATGFIFWVESRRKKGAVSHPLKIRFVEAMAVGSVTGIIIASGAFFVANRLLPADAAWAGATRAGVEIRIFFGVWLLTFIHPVVRAGKAWAEQSWAIAGLCIAAVVLNAVTTDDHLFAAATRGLWQVAGMDLVLLAGAATAVCAALKLQRHDNLTAGARRNAAPSATAPQTRPAE